MWCPCVLKVEMVRRGQILDAVRGEGWQDMLPDWRGTGLI